jgi:hypothetical protein
MTKVCREMSRPATAPSAILFLRDPSSESSFRGNFGGCSKTRFTKINRSALRRKLSTPMFSIAIFVLMVLSPVLVPAAITAFHAVAAARQRSRQRIANSLGDGVGSIGGQSISHEHTHQAAVL